MREVNAGCCGEDTNLRKYPCDLKYANSFGSREKLDFSIGKCIISLLCEEARAWVETGVDQDARLDFQRWSDTYARSCRVLAKVENFL